MFLFDTALPLGISQIDRLVTGPSAPDAGMGAAVPIMLVDNSGLSWVWRGGPDGTAGGGYVHTVVEPFRADYTVPVWRGIGDGSQIGPQVTTKMLWDRPEGDWSDNNDPRRDLDLYAGGAMLIFEGHTHDTVSLARPYFDWTGNSHRTELRQDIEYGLNFARAAAQSGVAPYLGGTWPQLIADQPDDTAWRSLIAEFDEALRYRRNLLSARVRAEGLPGAVWIVPFQQMFARFYDNGLAGLLPAGITSHRDFHALDDYYTNCAGNHPYMPNPLSAYCAWCMIREVVMGEDASTIPPWPVDGVTADIAAYLRGVAIDIARSYASAGQGGSQHAALGYIEPVPATPQVALGSTFAASWMGGAGQTATPAGSLDYGGAVLSIADVSGLTDTLVDLARITAPDGRDTLIVAWGWSGGNNVEIIVSDAGGGRLRAVQIQLPGPGDWLFEWRNLAYGLTLRCVDLNADPSNWDKVGVPVAGDAYVPGLSGASAIAASPPAWITLHPAWAGTRVPDAAQMVGLNAWIDGLTGLTAWD